LLFILLLFLAFQLVLVQGEGRQEISYSTFLAEVEAGNIAEIAFIASEEAQGKLREPRTLPLPNQTNAEVESFTVRIVGESESANQLVGVIRAANPDVNIIGKSKPMNWVGTLVTSLPFVLIIVIWLFFLRQMQAGGNRAFSFGKSKAKLINSDRPTVTFADVAGAEEAKVALQEIVEFLKAPRKFQRLGGRIPKGALVVGEPGTGKTLLARAVAGEAGVPFFTMSGSDFVEMFVGVGASRVRDLFEQGKKQAPCIIFIDEIDAVGRHRGAGLGGGHDEREQTLNQLLVEMDGFDTNEGVILIAATNRPDVLDPALLRPGRFDRQIVVDMPDLKGREGILKVHLRKIQASDDVSAFNLARGTPGMSGADLANIVNEGALLAARRNHEKVHMEDLEDAKENAMMGPERRSRVIPEEERKITAYHESGHAIVAAKQEGHDPVHKVTIIPRGMAGGLTMMLPENDRILQSRDWFIQRINTLMGGRVAEAIIFPSVTAGAYDDIKKATALARNMVTRFGMSDRLGPIAFGEGNEPIFLGRELGHRPSYSAKTAEAIDEEVTRIVTESYQTAESILRANMDSLHLMAETLLERETLDREEVRMILEQGIVPPVRVATEFPSAPAEEDWQTEPEGKPNKGLDGPILGGEAPPTAAG
jgi:cell division protease FtsH